MYGVHRDTYVYNHSLPLCIFHTITNTYMCACTRTNTHACTRAHVHAHTHSHFKCLSQHYILPQALEIMCVLLREIMSEVLDRDEQSLLVNSQQEAEESYSRRKVG